MLFLLSILFPYFFAPSFYTYICLNKFWCYVFVSAFVSVLVLVTSAYVPACRCVFLYLLNNWYALSCRLLAVFTEMGAYEGAELE